MRQGPSHVASHCFYHDGPQWVCPKNLSRLKHTVRGGIMSTTFRDDCYTKEFAVEIILTLSYIFGYHSKNYLHKKLAKWLEKSISKYVIKNKHSFLTVKRETRIEICHNAQYPLIRNESTNIFCRIYVLIILIFVNSTPSIWVKDQNQNGCIKPRVTPFEQWSH